MINEKLIKIITQTNPNLKVEEITETANFNADLHIDSLAMMDILLGIEEELGIKIEDEQIPNLKKVGDLSSLLLR